MGNSHGRSSRRANTARNASRSSSTPSNTPQSPFSSQPQSGLPSFSSFPSPSTDSNTPTPSLMETATQTVDTVTNPATPTHISRIALVVELFVINNNESPSETQDSNNELSTPHVPTLQPIRRMLLLLNEDFASRVIRGSGETDLNTLLNQIFLMHDSRGPPPASKKAIESLPLVTIDETAREQGVRCAVCFEDFQVGSQSIKLPCEHMFDQGCVTTWLKEHNTCPHCRYELPVDDEEYEKERRERMRQTRSEIDEDRFFQQANSTPISSSSSPEGLGGGSEGAFGVN